MFIPWLKNRKNTFIGIFIDVIILLLIFINEKFYLNNINQLVFLMVIPWILISYIYGRYSFENKIVFSRILVHLILSNLVAIVLLIIFKLLVNGIFSLFNLSTIICSASAILETSALA